MNDNDLKELKDFMRSIEIDNLSKLTVSDWEATLQTFTSLELPTAAHDGLQNPMSQQNNPDHNASAQQCSQLQFPSTSNSSRLQNQLHQKKDQRENISAMECSEDNASASANIPNQNNLVTNADRLQPIRYLLANSINEAYLKDDVLEVPPNSLGFLVAELICKNQHQEAIKHCKESLNQMRPKEDAYAISQVYNYMASVYIDLKNYEEALNILNKVLELRKNLSGYEHLSVASVLNNMAVVHGKNGDYSDAYILCKQSLDIKLAHLDTSHLEVAKQYFNLGTIDMYVGGYARALRYYRKSLSIHEQRLGPDNTLTLKNRAIIGYCFHMIRSSYTT